MRRLDKLEHPFYTVPMSASISSFPPHPLTTASGLRALLGHSAPFVLRGQCAHVHPSSPLRFVRLSALRRQMAANAPFEPHSNFTVAGRQPPAAIGRPDAPWRQARASIAATIATHRRNSLSSPSSKPKTRLEGRILCRGRDLNSRPRAYESPALLGPIQSTRCGQDAQLRSLSPYI
jgi:hypothetical protein